MKLKNKIELIFLLFLTIFLFSNTKSFAGSQDWNSLDYNVEVKNNGDMDIIETWDINIRETNTLFKDFDIDYSKYSGISNVKVSIIDSGEEKFLKEIYKEQYHVDKGCYYGLPIKNNSQFEIAWNVGLDDSSASRTYKIYYTVKNAVKVYNDCTELYWQFLGTDNQIPGKNITGRIKLPKKVDDIEKLRVWGHGSLTGEITKVGNDLVEFNMPKLSRNSMLEVRIVTEENIYDMSDNKHNNNYLDSILSEEKKWADEANAERESARNTKKIIIGILIICILINIFFVVFFIRKIRGYIKSRKELKEKYANNLNELKYFREIPNEEISTPARALYLYKFENIKPNFTQSEISKIFSATILDLSLKKIIHFEPIEKNDIKIVLDDKRETLDLPDDEKRVHKTLLEAIEGKDSITTKEFKKFAKKNYNLIYARFIGLGRLMEKNTDNMLDNTKKQISEQIESKQRKYLLLFCLSFILMFVIPIFPTIPIGLITCIFVLSKNLKAFSILNEEGMAEAQKWRGLKNYMTDYSLLKERLVPDILLWEKYLVYATVFGVAEKVIKQLKIVHPEMFTAENTYYSYGYWNIITNSSLGIESFTKFSSDIENVYSSAISSYNAANSIDTSSSGGGGGFSSGGRRPEAAEAAVEVVRI